MRETCWMKRWARDLVVSSAGFCGIVAVVVVLVWPFVVAMIGDAGTVVISVGRRMIGRIDGSRLGTGMVIVDGVYVMLLALACSVSLPLRDADPV